MHHYPRISVTGVILAGGRAKRMGGQDKGLILLAGQPMAAHAVQIMRPQVGELLINANRHIDDYRTLCCPVVRDDAGEFFGPLAGMLAAIDVARTPYVLTVPCDSPLIPADYAERMYHALMREGAEISVASSGERLQPVFALLSTKLRDSLREYLEAGERKIDHWFAGHRTAVADFSANPEMFRNINTPEELAALEEEIMRGSQTMP